MSKGGDNRRQRAHVRQSVRDGESAGEAGLSTGAQRQIGHADQEQAVVRLHAEKAKT
jgi:hypothetical protein